MPNTYTNPRWRGACLAATIAALIAAPAAFAESPALQDSPHMDMSHGGMSHTGMSNMHATPPACAELTLACATTATPFIAEDGTLWIAARVGDRLFVTTSRDHAKSFSDPVAIDVGAVTLDWGPDARPKIVVDHTGKVTLAYATFRDKAFNGEVFVTRSLDGGKTFAPVAPITDIQESQRFVDLELDTDGRIFAVWLDKRNRVPFKAAGKDYPGAGLAFAWSDGEGFGKARIALDNTCECCRIAAAFKAPGQPVLLFRNIFAGGVRDHAMITFENAETPGPVQRVSVDDWQVNACPHHGPSLAIAPDGSYHATWFTQGRARQGLFYAYSRDGGAHFSDPQQLGPAGAVLSRPFVLASGETIRLAWKAFDGNETKVMTMTSLDGGAHFGSARVASSTAKNSDHPILVQDRGHVFLSWETQEGYRLIPLDDAS